MNDANSINKAITFSFMFIVFRRTFKVFFFGELASREVNNFHFYFYLFLIFWFHAMFLFRFYIRNWLVWLGRLTLYPSFIHLNNNFCIFIFFLSHLQQNILFYFISVFVDVDDVAGWKLESRDLNRIAGLISVFVYTRHISFTRLMFRTWHQTTFGCACDVLDVAFSRR